MEREFIHNMIVTDRIRIRPYGEHNGKNYYVYLDNISPNLIYFKFVSRWQMQEFLYRNGIEEFDYKSSNGSVTKKVFEYIPEEINNLKVLPEKYSFDDYCLGHFIKQK